MKTWVSIFLVALFFLCGNNVYAGRVTGNPADEQEESSVISIVTVPELESLVAAWVSSYRQLDASQNFEFGDDAEMPNRNSLYFFTSNRPVTISGELAGKIVVGHEIIVPVMNAGNPMAERLLSEGITAADLAGFLAAGNEAKFLKPDASNTSFSLHLTDDEVLESKLSAFCGIDKAAVIANRASSPEVLLSAVVSDKNAIGFCRVADVLNQGKNEFVQGILIVPIDKNSNGLIDGFEKIYSSPEELTRGAWIGKYPRKLCSEVFAASATLPMDEASARFMDWVINEGQESLASLGFSAMSSKERSAGSIAMNPVSSSGNTGSVTASSNLWMFAAAVAALIFIIVLAFRATMKRKARVQGDDLEMTRAMNVETISAPAGLFYDKTHTWAFMEQSGLVKVGINDFLPHVTGRLTQVKMKMPGDKVRKGEKIITLIQEGKKLEIGSPVTGTIKTQNKSLLSNPSQINSNPYSTGWVYEVEPSNWLRETKFLFMAAKFNEWLEEEFVRLKDFLAASANKNALVYNHIVLQDGGELTDNVLANLEPEVWEDFQTQFLDTSR